MCDANILNSFSMQTVIAVSFPISVLLIEVFKKDFN